MLRLSKYVKAYCRFKTSRPGSSEIVDFALRRLKMLEWACVFKSEKYKVAIVLRYSSRIL